MSIIEEGWKRIVEMAKEDLIVMKPQKGEIWVMKSSSSTRMIITNIVGNKVHFKILVDGKPNIENTLDMGRFIRLHKIES